MMLHVSLTFIHIGKTGGTYLKRRLRKASRTGPIPIKTSGSHSLTLPRALRKDPETQIIFAIRAPEALFVSAFNSRQRKGQPRRFVEHSPGEALAFERFQTADELAVALGSPRSSVRGNAADAMKEITHLRRGYSWFLKNLTTLERYADRIDFIFQTETLDDDLAIFAHRLGITIPELKKDTPARRHAAPGDQPTSLSRRGRRALRRHWQKEFRIYEWARHHREELLRGQPARTPAGSA